MVIGNAVNFSVYSRYATDCTLVLFHNREEKPFIEIPFFKEFRLGNVFSMMVFDLDYENIEYGYRMDGPFLPADGHRFDKTKILLDPYAKLIVGRDVWGKQPNLDNIYQYRARVVFDDFDWENDLPLETPVNDLIVYEMHVRNFTCGAGSGVKHKGTFAGIVEKIPYLKELGVNCVELMPIHEFDEFENYRPSPVDGHPLYNLWGYSNVGFFAPKAAYASSGRFSMQVDELKNLVKRLHANGIEVMLDVVFNHTAEGDQRGPYISYRGIDNKTYYMLTPDGGYFNFSGCGNTLNCNNPNVRDMIVESLRYWVTDYHIDGFRFDLAAILGRDQNGNPIYDSYSGKYHYGDTYNVVSPSISGYTAQSASVAGTITGSVGFVVTYTVNAQPVPTPSVTYTVRTPAQAYHAASYYTQKQVNPELAGFAKTSKVYALAKCDSFLNVREGKSYSNRIVGVLYPNNLCYIIDDSDEKWTYIESGTVRGFVDKQYLLTGKKANQYVRKTGESKMTLAKQIIAPANNTAFRFALKTVRELPSSFNYRSATTTADRQAMIAFSEQFLGNPYVWGGESLTEGCDCSGFTMLIYRQFGIELPRCSYEQAEVGMKIPAMDALPGDLLFYARDGAVYHVLMYIGNGQAINASSSTTGIIISNVDYNKTCWGVRVIEDAAASSTQVSELVEIGQRAKDGDESAQQEIIQALVTASKDEWSQYGYLPSVLIAQVIEETKETEDWMLQMMRQNRAAREGQSPFAA